MVEINICEGYKKDCTNKEVREGLCRNCIGEKFRDDVRKLLIEIWDTHPNPEEPLFGGKCDIYIIKREIEKINIRYYIECKDLDRNVRSKEINKFILDFIPLKLAHQVDMGIIVSKLRFSPGAIEKSRLFNITLLSYEDFKDIVERRKMGDDKRNDNDKYLLKKHMEEILKKIMEKTQILSY